MLHKSSDEQKGSELPTLNYVWIGPPANPLQGDIAGHDVAGVKLMAESLKEKNKIRFWCLDQYVEQYREKLADYPIEVCSVEKYLNKDFDDLILSQDAQKIKEIFRESLKSGRNIVRDRVTCRDSFLLFLLSSEGGYTLDTNVYPLPGEVPHFPAYPKLYVPFVGNGEESEEEEKRIDCWCMFNPVQSKKPKLMLDCFYQKWLETERIFSTFGYDKYYYNKIGTIIISSIENACTDGDYGTWDAPTANNDVSREVKELNIVKYYYNTHIYEMTASANSSKLFRSAPKPPPQIFVAVLENTTYLLEQLIAHDASLIELYTSKEANNETLLHYAVRSNKPEHLKLLLETEKIDLSAIVKYNRVATPMTAYDLAKKLPCKDCCNVFEAYFKTQELKKSSGTASK